MGVIGRELDSSTLVLTKGRDFIWKFVHRDSAGNNVDFPAGDLFFEIYTDPVLTWTFSIVGSEASLKVESEIVDTVPNRTRWQLVFKEDGEAAGGEPLALGVVRLQK